MAVLALIGTWFRTNPRNVWLIAILIASVVILGLAYMRGRSDQAKRDEARIAVAEQAAIKSDDKADRKADEALAKAARDRAKLEEELIDAVMEAPDSLPDAAAVALACQRLRDAKVPGVADLPACRAPA